jgi:hypothetical protein
MVLNIINPMASPLAEWYHIFRQAQERAGYTFTDELESYLIITLDHYTSHAELINEVLALEFLQHANLKSSQSCSQMRTLGDHCLILSGLFPENAQQKNVSLNYFISLGKGCYSLLSDAPDQLSRVNSDIFIELSANFIGLMDILHHMRKLEGKPDNKQIIL